MLTRGSCRVRIMAASMLVIRLPQVSIETTAPVAEPGPATGGGMAGGTGCEAGGPMSSGRAVPFRKAAARGAKMSLP